MIDIEKLEWDITLFYSVLANNLLKKSYQPKKIVWLEFTAVHWKSNCRHLHDKLYKCVNKISLQKPKWLQCNYFTSPGKISESQVNWKNTLLKTGKLLSYLQPFITVYQLYFHEECKLLINQKIFKPTKKSRSSHTLGQKKITGLFQTLCCCRAKQNLSAAWHGVKQGN